MWPLVAMILGVLAAAFGLVLLVGYQIRKESKKEKEGEAQKPHSHRP
jgi:predicted outer membrane lipoprotein